MAQNTDHHYLVILCGGTGPRLWPLSRADHPKQFLKLFSDNSILQETILRAKKVTDSDHILIVSNTKYTAELTKETKGLIPSKNILAEPLKKNTAMAILYAAAVIQSRDPDAVITSLPSDHYINPVSRFAEDIKHSSEIASGHNVIVTIGISPTSPNPAYGYILPKKSNGNFSFVQKFIEKPNPRKALTLIQKGALWNSGIYTFTAQTLITEFAHLNRDYSKLFDKLASDLNNSKVVEKVYKLSPALAIDVVISEKSKKMVTLPASFSWSDIGEWQTIFGHYNKQGEDNVNLYKHRLVTHKSVGNLVVNTNPEKLIGLVGVRGLAVIDTQDALLVCDLNSSFEVRDLVGQLVSDKKTENYFLQSPEK
ncbi:MAG TPA: mannose-1-phosphate guanylyltransferase [Patescibacteria group bacterium]